ncbi:Lcl C-terminal domain-containing protein [Psychrobacter sp. I-STPA10]|uniref:Lcl C-terminal domain-containing protein n=1 Tax=Psychrobacter sp. I-STPA10 TaxID=2585769 RepID=UPI001E41ABBF|nr:DUF1566 domain-containing protein [Psychrobacter sp. I-STPA10]
MNITKIYQALAISSLLVIASSANALEQQCNEKSRRTAQNDRYEVIGNGEEVKDKQTGLIWQRCVVGETWDGNSCTGVEDSKSLTWHEALKVAKAKADSTKKPYRVPNIKELASLTSYGCSPSFNTTYFETGVEIFDFIDNAIVWSSSPNIGEKGSSYTYSQHDGIVRIFNVNETYAVRLVRSE